MATKSTRRYAEAGRRAAEAQRRIQEQSKKAAKAAKTTKTAKAVKAQGNARRAVEPPGRRYPEPPLPQQHQPKPGLESARPAPPLRGAGLPRLGQARGQGRADHRR